MLLYFLRDPTYPEHEDQLEAFERDLGQTVREELPDSQIKGVDAGPSASIPGYIIEWTLIGMGLLAIPGTLKDNLPLWFSYVRKGIDALRRKGLDPSLSPAAASIVAMKTAYDAVGTDDVLEIERCTRSWINLNGPASEVLDWPPPSPNTEIEHHFESIRMLNPSYVCWIRSSSGYVIVGVDHRGEVYLCRIQDWK